MRVLLTFLAAAGLASCAGGGQRAQTSSAIESADLHRVVAASGTPRAQYFVAPEALHAGPPSIIVPGHELDQGLVEARTTVTVHPIPDDAEFADPVPVRGAPANAPPVHRAPPLDPTPPGVIIAPSSAPPQTAGRLTDALRSAYDTNPTVNRARSNVREADENVAIARAGSRPTISIAAEGGWQSARSVNTVTSNGSGTVTQDQLPGAVSLEISQPLFRGFRTRNATRAAAAGVRAERQRLRATQQDALLATAVAFLDVRRFRSGEALRQREVDFLNQQVEDARNRLEFGEGTATDIDQAQSRLAEARALLLDERGAAREAEARFREFSNLDPGRLQLDIDLARLLPPSLGEALRAGQDDNPDIQLALHQVDAANFEVATIEGERLPTVSLTGSVGMDAGSGSADRNESAEVKVNVSVPIYQGGGVSARVRQAKEALGGARIDVDIARNQTRADIASAWSAYRAAGESVAAADESIAAARRTVAGFLEELRVGQRTTTDVLDAQRDLIRVQVTREIALRQRDSAAFELLRALGKLDPAMLGLDTIEYDPVEHYEATKDRWAGLRTPDGR